VSRKRAFIVDGYNVLRRGVPYSMIAAEDLDAARTRLVSDIAAFAQGEIDVIVVFDGAGNPHSDGAPHDVAGLTVIFSPYAVDADTVIEHAALAERATGADVTVVTSDAQTQWAVMGMGVARMSSDEFITELAGERAEYRHAMPSGAGKSTVSERIDSDVAAALARWARGEP
jgi:predicted RNA-binding protein with PIN domain